MLVEEVEWREGSRYTLAPMAPADMITRIIELSLALHPKLQELDDAWGYTTHNKAEVVERDRLREEQKAELERLKSRLNVMLSVTHT